MSKIVATKLPFILLCELTFHMVRDVNKFGELQNQTEGLHQTLYCVTYLRMMRNIKLAKGACLTCLMLHSHLIKITERVFSIP